MTNNDILKKLRIALSFKDTDILEVLKLADFHMTKSELSAIFRKEDHPNYKRVRGPIIEEFFKRFNH